MPLIVIEGTDGSGKRTQTELLLARCAKEGVAAATLSFPQYGKKSAGPIEELLNGRYGPPDAVNPRVASLFYAIDRFDASEEIKKILSNNTLLILDRYVDSNAAHQGGKIADERERELFIEWLYALEYETLGIPRPDFSMILHVPAEVSLELIKKKPARAYIASGNQHDEIEKNLDHLRRSEQCYLWLASKNPDTHHVIECVENSALLSPDAIHDRVWTALCGAGFTRSAS